MSGRSVRRLDIAWAVAALAAIAMALWQLLGLRAGLDIERVTIGTTPATIYRPAGAGPAPAIVIAHGFAGSQQLMQSFALTFARNGFVAVTFDFLGHGRNPAPLAGSITEVSGATRNLAAQTAEIVAAARRLGDGRVALLGHSMASDIVIRVAQADPGIAATIAVSAFSPVVTKDSPRNLLLISGGWESYLRAEALKLAGQVAAPAPAEEGVTYGDLASGTARRAVVVEGTEHVSVLYGRSGLSEAQAWLDAAFGGQRKSSPEIAARGGWIVLLLAGIILLVRPLAALLPVVSQSPAGAGLGWRRLWPALLVPALATPLILRVVPTHFLPVLVGDYLAAHFLLYGLLSCAMLRWAAPLTASPFTTRLGPTHPTLAHSSLAHPSLVRPSLASATLVRPSLARLLGVAALATLACLGSLGVAIDAFVTSFMPSAARLPLILALLVGTSSYVLATEWLTRGTGAGRGAYIVSQLAFLVSLGLAIGLDFQRLFFLAIIVPVIVPFLLVFGLFSGWLYRRTGHPWVAGIANAIAFAWAIGVTFPLLAG